MNSLLPQIDRKIVLKFQIVIFSVFLFITFLSHFIQESTNSIYINIGIIIGEIIIVLIPYFNLSRTLKIFGSFNNSFLYNSLIFCLLLHASSGIFAETHPLFFSEIIVASILILAVVNSNYFHLIIYIVFDMLLHLVEEYLHYNTRSNALLSYTGDEWGYFDIELLGPIFIGLCLIALNRAFNYVVIENSKRQLVVQDELKGIIHDSQISVEISEKERDKSEKVKLELEAAWKEAEIEKKRAEKARAEAERANEEKSKFLANMSHEIRTPLNTIIGGTSILIKNPGKENLDEYLPMIKISGLNLLNIINDILDLSKIEAGEITLEKKEFTIYSIVNESVSSMELKAKEKGIYLKYSYDKQLEDERIVGDKYRLTQIIINLMSNAIKFTEKGGIIVSIKVLNQTETDITIKFSIKDTGIGISKDKLIRIFDPFKQAEDSTTRQHGGTGLGLSICKKLLSLHDSYVDVKSELNKGSQFSFTIVYKKYIHKKIRAVSKEKSETYDSYSNKVSDFDLDILLAEDMLFNQKIMEGILIPLGCKLTIANNGEEAVKICETHNFDLILMDIHMPVMDGVTAVKKIRESKLVKYKLVIYFLSADAINLHSSMYEDSGVNGFLTKPIDEKELIKVLNKISRKQLKTNILFSMDNDEQKNYSIEKIRELTTDISFIKSLIDIFKSSVMDDVKSMQKAIDNEDIQELRDIIHKVSPSFDYLGLKVFLIKLENISKIAKSTEDLKEIQTIYHEIIENIDLSIEDIEKTIYSEDFKL